MHWNKFHRQIMHTCIYLQLMSYDKKIFSLVVIWCRNEKFTFFRTPCPVIVESCWQGRQKLLTVLTALQVNPLFQLLLWRSAWYIPRDSVCVWHRTAQWFCSQKCWWRNAEFPVAEFRTGMECMLRYHCCLHLVFTSV